MSEQNKLIAVGALKNGVFWSAVLLLLTYFKNGLINLNYFPLWFVFFALTGAVRKYYLLKRKK